MGNYDPIQERIDARKDAELERLRASCNSLASERDLLKKERDAWKQNSERGGEKITALRKERDDLAEDKRRLLVGAENLLRYNQQLSERLANALSPARRVA
jgi:hypothetical protein